jgi:hypothetical protein
MDTAPLDDHCSLNGGQPMMMRRALVFGLPALLAALPGSSAAQSWKKTFPGYTLEQIGPTNTANGRGVTRFVQKFNGGGQKDRGRADRGRELRGPSAARRGASSRPRPLRVDGRRRKAL